MQGLSIPAIAATLIASVSLPMMALNVTTMPGDPASGTGDAQVLAEECRYYAASVARYRMRLMGAYADPSDRERERQLLIYYERQLGRDCGD